MISEYLWKSPIGILHLAEDGKGICRIEYAAMADAVTGMERPTELLQQAIKELQEYFDGKRKEFTLPISVQGTEFQMAVWDALCSIPYGETRSYGEIAVQIGRPKACRAVGMANHVNPVAIVVPCHRVIASGGKIGGYGGGLEIKQMLLTLEKNHSENT